MSQTKKIPSTPLYYIRSSIQAKKRSLSQLISPDHSKSNNSITISDVMSPMANSMQALAASHEELLMRYVLASAEIERLVVTNSTIRRETDQWRMKYKECEALLRRKSSIESEMDDSHIYKLKYEKERARVSLLEEDNTTLQETLNSKEEELRTLTEASIGAIGVDLLEKDKEIEFWKEKYEKLENERIVQLKDLRQKTEIVLRTKIEREVSEALKKYEQEKKQMKVKCEELTKEIQNLKGQIEFVNNEKVSMSTQINKIREKSSSDKEENKILLAGQVKKFQQDVEEKKNKILQLLDQLEQNEKERLRLNSELERSKEENHHFEERMRGGLKEKEEKIIEMIGQIQSLKEEVEILQIENSRLLREIEQVKTQNEYESMTQRNELQEEKSKLGGQLEEVKQELEFSKKEIERLLEELDNATKKNNNEEEMKELKEMQLALTIHIDRQNQELEFLHKEREKFARQREADVRALKEMDKEKNHITMEYNTLQLRLDILQGDLNYANEEKEEFLKDLEVKEGVCKKLEEAYGMIAKDSVVLSAEIERLRLLLKEKSDRVEELEGYINDKVREMEGLQVLYDKEMKEKDVEVNSFKTKLDAQKWHLVELQKEIVELNKELESSGKGKVKRDQMSQCGVGKVGARTTEDLIEEYSEKIRLYEKEMKNLSEENERLQEDKEYKEKLEKEVIELRGMNLAHKEERIALKRENDALGELAEEMSEYTQLLKDARKERGDLKERLEMLEREYEELKIENRVKEQEIEANRLSRVEVVERYETKINHLVERNSMLTMDNEEIKDKISGQLKAIQQKENIEKELEILKTRLMEMIKDARDVDSAMRRIEEMMVRSERLEKEMREWKELYHNEQEKNAGQKREIERLVREYNEMLQKLGSAIDHKDKGHEAADILLREVKDDKATIKRLNEELWMLRNESEHVRIEGNNKQESLEKRLQEAEHCVERVKEAVGGVRNFEMVMLKIGEMKLDTMRLSEWKQIYEEKEKGLREKEDLKRSRNDGEGLKIRKLEMELETTRTSVTARDKEIHEERILYEETMRGIRENYKELESNYLILGETNKSLEGRIQTLMREIGILRNKEEDTHKANKSLISQLKEAEERIMQQIGDIVKLNEKLAAKQKEMDLLEENIRGGGGMKEKIERIEVDLRKDVEKELMKSNEEYLIKKREVENQLVDFKKRAEEDLKEKRYLIDKNEKLQLEVDDLAREVKVLKARQDDLIRASEIRLNVLKVEEQQGARALKEKEIQKIQQDFTERVSSYENEIKQLRMRISEFELQQVLYFIEVERLHGVNSEFMEEFEKSQAETSQYKQVIEEFSREIGREKQQKMMLEDIIADLRTQVEGYENRLEIFGRGGMRSPPARDQDILLPLMRSPVVSNYITPNQTTRDSMVMDKRLAHSRFASIRKSRSELQEATEKFESEKNVMEMKLEQFKKIIQVNKSELQSPSQISGEKNQKENIMVYETVQEGSQQDSADQYWTRPTYETEESNDRMRGSLRVPKNLMSQISLFNRRITNNENVMRSQNQGGQGERTDYFNNPIFEMTEEETRRSFK